MLCCADAAARRRAPHAFHTRPRRCGTAHRRFSAKSTPVMLRERRFDPVIGTDHPHPVSGVKNRRARGVVQRPVWKPTKIRPVGR